MLGVTLLIAAGLMCVMGCRLASQAATQAVPAEAFKDQTPIAEAFEEGLLAGNVQMAPGSHSVMLYDLVLLEDDGPGSCGARDQYSPCFTTTVSGDVMAKKILHLDRAGVLSARVVLCVGPMSGEKAPLQVSVNGRIFGFRVADYLLFAEDWPVIQIPASLLHEGDNEIIFSCAGGKGWWVQTARRSNILLNAPDRKDHPNRSFRSTDAGGTWAPGLGDDGKEAGEFMIRLHLGQYVPRGELIGPVIDLASSNGGNSLTNSVQVQSVRLRVEKKIRKGTRIELEYTPGG